MVGMRVRVAAGVGAWLLGATTATGLSLFAVSYLGPDVAGAQGSTLSPEDVGQALNAALAASPSASAPASPGTTSPSQVPTETAATPTLPSQRPSSTSVPTSPSSQSTWSAKRQLSGQGGQVVAQCQGRLVYLTSWSPAQGYRVVSAERGPARYATVVFVDGLQQPWSFHVVCSNGIPIAASDDGGHDD